MFARVEFAPIWRKNLEAVGKELRRSGGRGLAQPRTAPFVLPSPNNVGLIIAIGNPAAA